MRRAAGIFVASTLTSSDFIVTLLLYFHGNKFREIFEESLLEYTFTSSVFELFFLSLLRVCILLGLILGLFQNYEVAVVHIKACQKLGVICAAICVMFTLVKLLAVAEDEALLHSVWFWCLFALSLIASISFGISWAVLGNISCSSSLRLPVNCPEDQSEHEPLLGPRLSQTDEKEKKELPKVNRGLLLRLIRFSKPDWPLVFVGFIFLSISATGEIFIPFYTGKVVDGIVIDKSEREFTSAILTMSAISVVSAIAAGIRGGCFFVANRRLNIRVRNALFAAIMNQEIGFFDTTQTGEITSRLTADTTTMSEALGLNVNIFLRSLIKAGGVVFFMFKLSWRLTIVTFIGLPCIMFISEVYGKYYKRLAEKVTDSLADVNNVAEESCGSMRTVRSFANEMGETRRYRDKLSVTYTLNKKQAFMYSGFVWSSMLFELLLTVSVLYYGGRLVIAGYLTGGTLISFILYQIQLGDCVNSMGSVYTGLMEALGASQKVFTFMERKPAIIPDGTLAPDQLQGCIEYQDVTFAYPSRPDVDVLKNLSFTVKPGEVVALVGPSGGGKTSCVNLLEHFYTPKSGRLLLDGAPIQQYDHQYLHKKISLVGQEPVLYARTIAENISYGLEDSETSQMAIEEAARLANAHTFVSELKDGYQTQAGEKGVQLSGGQKQRIAIARALLRKPVVLLLDEATSALDAESEYLVQQALYQNLGGRTVMIIAHRLSTVERADRILVIHQGTVVEQGSHLQLLEAGGMYSQLVKRQLLLGGEGEKTWNQQTEAGPD